MFVTHWWRHEQPRNLVRTASRLSATAKRLSMCYPGPNADASGEERELNQTEETVALGYWWRSLVANSEEAIR